MLFKIVRRTMILLSFVQVLRRNIFSAYIDPNTGGMLFQILAVLFGVLSSLILVFSGKIKSAFYRVKRLFQGSQPKQRDESEIHVE